MAGRRHVLYCAVELSTFCAHLWWMELLMCSSKDVCKVWGNRKTAFRYFIIKLWLTAGQETFFQFVRAYCFRELCGKIVCGIQVNKIHKGGGNVECG